MSARKATPDVLGAVLGGAPGNAVTPEITSGAAAGAPAAPALRPVEWEYREVIFRDYRGWRARAVNGVELGDWKTSPTILEYLEQAGRDGWELVSMGDQHNNHKEAYFKRPKL